MVVGNGRGGRGRSRRGISSGCARAERRSGCRALLILVFFFSLFRTYTGRTLRMLCARRRGVADEEEPAFAEEEEPAATRLVDGTAVAADEEELACDEDEDEERFPDECKW